MLAFIVIPIFICCLIVTCLIINRVPLNQVSFDSLSRNSTLDGLRGILALCVLVHHFYITYFWKTTGVWKRPESDLLNNFGAIPVSLFFLITGYLFLSKLKDKNINWKNLYFSRIKRIFPLYFFVLIIILLITIFTIENTYTNHDFVKWVIRWILFKGTDLAGFQTTLIIAGVSWTLVYEWAFYLSLPLIYSFLNRKVENKKLLICTLLLFLFMASGTSKNMYLLFFLSYPAICYKHEIKSFFDKNKFSVSVFLTILLIYCFISTSAYSFEQKIILSIIFLFIANGFNFFGMLNIKGVKILGDISFSTYLIHGLILYIFFTLFEIFNFNNDLVSYYMYFPLVFLIVVLVSFITYIFIERPFLSRSQAKLDTPTELKDEDSSSEILISKQKNV